MMTLLMIRRQWTLSKKLGYPILLGPSCGPGFVGLLQEGRLLLTGNCTYIFNDYCTHYRYVDISKEAEEEVMSASTQIERDLLRTLPDNRCFSKIDAPGVEALRRVLKSLAYFYPELGYCQV